VLEPDLSQLNSNINSQVSELPEEALQMPVSEASSEEKAVPVAA
jgi:hypothetical protein